jgi:Protein of unknown function (DUF2971).
MTEQQNNKLLREFEQELTKLYPTFEFGFSHGSMINGEITGQLYEFLVCQKAFGGLDYDFKPQNEFIHYTSLDAFYGILNTGEIRLYDLSSLNDPYEFNYIIKKNNIQFENAQIEKFKRSLFITSLCTYNDDIKDKFEMWRLYGQNGLGVAIVFTIENPNDNWLHFLLGKVQYGSDKSSSKVLLEAINLINVYIRDKGMILERIPELFGYLLMLHKNEIWKTEEEYRLGIYAEHIPYSLSKEILFDHEINQLVQNNFSLFINRRGNESSYLTIPLQYKLQKEFQKHFENEEEYEKFLKKVPQIRIKKVVAGYALSDKLVNSLKMFAYTVSTEKWKHYIQVEESHLNEWFK